MGKDAEHNGVLLKWCSHHQLFPQPPNPNRFCFVNVLKSIRLTLYSMQSLFSRHSLPDLSLINHSQPLDNLLPRLQPLHAPSRPLSDHSQLATHCI